MKNKGDIYIVTPSFAGGGAEFIAISVANYYHNIGLNVNVICFKKKGPFLKQLNEKIQVIDFDNDSLLNILFKLIKFFKSKSNARVISTVRISNILTGISSYLLPKNNCKFLFLEVNTYTKILKANKYKKFIWRLLIFISYRKANILVACSKDVLNQLKFFIKNKFIHKVGNPSLDPNFRKLKNKKTNHPWIKDKKYKVLLNMGRLHSQKNQKFLIRAMPFLIAEDRNIRLIIMGSGEKRKDLENLVKSINMTKYVDIIGFQQNPYPFLKGSDLFVMSSIYEGFGIVFIMAAACGLRIVSSACEGGPNELLIDPDIGKTYILDDYKDYTKKVFSFLNTAQDVGSKRKQVRFFTPYTVEAVANRYLSLLNEN
tara:strand:+ start:11596 stop:12708 length:1113 start_codon:yes stop_codon:yes gene_type:complete